MPNLICRTCGFVTSLPPALCPLCGDEMEPDDQLPEFDLVTALIQIDDRPARREA